jgi:hypothetical protein
VSDEQGVKYDQGKPRWALLPWREVTDIVRVLTWGCTPIGQGGKGYPPDNWKRVDDGRRRYFEAAVRHITDWHQGERLDPQSKLPHLAHAACCLLFAAWMDNEEATAQSMRDHAGGK